MTYTEAVEIIALVLKQYEHGHHVSQVDYNNFSDALKLCETVRNKL